MVGRPDVLPMRSTLIMAEETRQQGHRHEEMNKNSSPSLFTMAFIRSAYAYRAAGWLSRPSRQMSLKGIQRSTSTLFGLAIICCMQMAGLPESEMSQRHISHLLQRSG